MNRELGLRLLSAVMDWDDDQSRKEFQWLSFMATYKYDGYRDYCAGARFIESLATWLQQFNQEERPIAYDFVRNKLIYFSPGEIHRLVEKLFPEFVQEHLIERVANKLGIPSYLVWASKNSKNEYACERRRALFMGLSDGARIDTLRRVNAGVISNEQVVIATQIDQQKWNDLLKELGKDISNIQKLNNITLTSSEKFSCVYLLDDFTASGVSLLREDPTDNKLKGKLIRFLESVKEVNEVVGSPFTENYNIFVHHYIGTAKAKERIESFYSQVKDKLRLKYGVNNINFTFGMILPHEISITESSSEPFVQLCKKYYDEGLHKKGIHSKQSGVETKMFGYAGCGLPVVLEHNTPNNSLALIWARTYSNDAKIKMRPLFLRRERHSDMEYVTQKPDTEEV